GLSLNLQKGQRDLQGDLTPVLGPSLKLNAAPARQTALARPAELFETGFGAHHENLGNQSDQGSADHLRALETEGRFGGPVKLQDGPLLIDADDGVGGGVQSMAEFLFALFDGVMREQ